MILVIFVIALILLIGGVWIASDSYDRENIGITIGVVGGVGTFVSVIATFILCIEVFSGSSIDGKIAMYQEENAAIEAQVSAIVEQYKQYESDTFADAKDNTDISSIVLYPELKSDQLVQSQIDVYVENKKIITDLMAEKCELEVARWWLYFG